MFEMTNPFYLLGLLAAFVPLALHLWGKRKAPKIEFAALHFLFKSDKKIKRHLRIRDFFMLLVRMLACVAVTLVLAQPITKCQNNTKVLDQEFENVVFVVDNSILGTYLVDEETALDKARSLIDKQIKGFAPQTQIGMVFCDSKESPAIDLTLDRDTLVDKLADLKTSHRGRDCQEAVAQAKSMSEQASTSSTGVILAYPILKKEFENLKPNLTSETVRFRQLKEMTFAMPNIGIESITIEADIVSSNQYNVTVSILNQREDDINSLPLRLSVNGENLAETLVDLPADETTQKVISLAPPKVPKPWVVTASIDDPAFTTDNNRHILLQDHKRPFVLLVNGDPKRSRRTNETFFLETTLLKNDHPFALAFPETIDQDALSKADVVVLANVHTLDQKTMDQLKKAQQRGVGLLMSGGNLFDDITFRQSMTGLFPVPPVGIHDVKHGGMRENAKGLNITTWQADHPIFRKFLIQAKEINSAQFFKHVLFPPSKEAYTTLASFNNGSPAIVEFSNETFRSIYFTSTLDRDWNDFSIHQGFVPWLLETLKYLAFKESELENEVLLGAPFRTDKLKSFGSIQVKRPNGQTTLLPTFSKDGFIEFESLDMTGLYTFNSQENNTPQKSHVMIANADPTWCDLKTVTLPSQNENSTLKKPSTTNHKLWRFFSPFLVLVLLLEAYGSWQRTRQI